MKILKLLNKFFFSFAIISLLYVFANAEDQPVDIWNIDKKEIDQKSSTNENLTTSEDEEFKNTSETSIYEMQSQKKTNTIKLESSIDSDKIDLYGLYDPEDYDLEIGMWINSNGNQLKNIFSRINKIDLSEDATELMKIALLTNAYPPKIDISEKDFLNFRSEWLVKNSDLDLIEEYLIKNQIFDLHPKLTKYLLDYYLSESNVDKACNILSKSIKPINDEYLTKFNIYCLIITNKKDEAQIIFDLKKELGFKDEYFENKINYLLGFIPKSDTSISEKTVFDFHLAHKTNPDFVFEPNNDTKKIIWKYLSSFNLLNSFDQIEISELDKISTIEKATNNKNYPEKDLFEIYKRFQFNINQLLNAESSYKSLSKIEARALIYQKILLESEMVEKLKLLKLLKTLFKNDGIENAFDIELKKFLEKINPTDIPDNLTSFYYTNIEIKETTENKIKFNKDILHQSKLVNYFNGDYPKSKIERDIDNFLKRIKKNKKYFFSKKDQIFLESLRSDGIQISKKYNDLYKVDDSEVPTDIQVMINNGETGAALLRIVEVIGQDKVERIDEDTIYFIIRTLNQLNIDTIRNKIILKVLPLKV
tara:strand:- start:1974 stop:3749 length:1776 start_codon:yes stop_codon:yes gene_type:complete